MAEVAREVIVMVESAKISKKIPNLELTWQQIHTVITDDGLSDEMQTALTEQGVKLIIAKA
jgi:DeoR/GlpR family transcriptional regulator of sugar metabolism